MDERAAVPPGLPRPNPTASYWQSPLADIADHQSIANLPDSAEFVIIGSGISGASLAYNILSHQPDAKVLLLEARQAASGASGRNGMCRILSKGQHEL
jgi:FAD dependent oxidoreductase